MKNQTLKLRPMMKINEMVPYLKEKNIKFNHYSEQDAEIYLRENNNYYNVTSYKNNFVKNNKKSFSFFNTCGRILSEVVLITTY